MDQTNKISTVIDEYFEYEHLPLHLQEISKPFADLAKKIRTDLPMSAETTVAMRKLLEAKDCAVRVAVSAKKVEQIMRDQDTGKLTSG